MDTNETEVATQKLRRFQDPVGLAILTVTGLSVYFRLYYGIDLTDDSFYIGLPYSFALGHQPFVDELATHQFAGLLLLPAVDAYLAVVGSNAGLVLFARHLYFAASLASALLAREALSEVFGRRAGNLAAALALGYIPFLLPGLSYNSIACLGMLAGTMLLASACLPGRSPMRLGFGTFWVILASFAYPPVVGAAIVSLAVAFAGFWIVREVELRQRACIIVLASGLATGAAAIAVVHHYDGFAQLERLSGLSDAFGVQGGGLRKWWLLWMESRLQSGYLIGLLGTFVAILGGIYWVRPGFPAVAVAALVGPGLFAVESLYRPHREPFSTAPFVVMALGILAPVGVRWVRAELSPQARAALTIVASSSIVCAAIVLWATSNGLRNGAIGLLPACLVTLGCTALLRPRGLPRRDHVFVAFAVSLLAFQISQMWTHVYRDLPISQLDATIEDGAWKGIRTYEAKKAFIQTITRDLADARGDAETVLFMDYFPAGYLLSDLRPRTPSIWLFPWVEGRGGTRATREIYASGFPDPASFPDILVSLRCVPTYSLLPLPPEPKDPLALRLASKDYRAVTERDCYTISRATKGPG